MLESFHKSFHWIQVYHEAHLLSKEQLFKQYYSLTPLHIFNQYSKHREDDPILKDLIKEKRGLEKYLL